MASNFWRIGKALLVAGCMNVLPAGAQTGTLEGIVSSQGAAVEGAEVSYWRDRRFIRREPYGGWEPAAGEPVVSGTVRPARDGRFVIGGLPPGSYTLCAAVPAGGYLETCWWSGALTVRVSSGQVVSGVRMELRRGVEVRIRVRDSGRLLPQVGGPRIPPKLVLGVRTARGGFRPAQALTPPGTERLYSVTVPLDTPLHLWTFSEELALADDRGVSFHPKGGTAPFAVPSGSGGPEFVVVVTGRR